MQVYYVQFSQTKGEFHFESQIAFNNEETVLDHVHFNIHLPGSTRGCRKSIVHHA